MCWFITFEIVHIRISIHNPQLHIVIKRKEARYRRIQKSICCKILFYIKGFPGGSVAKESTCNVGD